MASFETAVQSTLLWEGGYVNNPADSGGETYRGISRKNWPNWNGWGYIDIERSHHDFPACLDMNLGLQGNVIDFYRQNYWSFDAITSQLIANKIFDLGVNVGKVHAGKIVQTAVNNVLSIYADSGINAKPITVDGIIGPGTIAAINATSHGSLLPKIKAAAIAYHTSIIASHPEDAIFLAGWIRRDQS